jgi:diguanylate cyclase (GGDEF)-like protein
MTPPLPAARSRLRLGVGGKLGLSIGSLVVIVACVAMLGYANLSRSNAGLEHLYGHNLRVIQVEADLANGVHDLSGSAAELLGSTGEAQRSALRLEQDSVVIPHVRESLGRLRALQRQEPARLAVVNGIGEGLDRYVELSRTGAYDVQAGAAGGRADLTRQTDALFGPMSSAIDDLRASEQQEAAASKQAEDARYHRARWLLLGSVAFSLLVGSLVVLLLSRNMVPRIRRYARFATEVADGRSTGHLAVSGTDELAVLGAALNDMTEQRIASERRERSQVEFVDALQVTSTEQEAHELIQRHLQRSLPGSSAVVLQRNNSANRLQAATVSSAVGSDLVKRLEGAEPRSCMAVRFARPHREGPTLDPLLACTLCSGRDVSSVCEPLLVGGEVIGSVLVEQEPTLGEDQHSLVKTSVGQAAPVLANLRSLALAEFRANNDSLTGLPNKRATDDTLKRMVAYANRSITPLAAIMLDLDHFKHINDQFGHGKGDEVLAAVGAALKSCLRDSDFAGRFGGEEFLVLLPDTAVEGALLVAEKVRLAVASINVPGVERDITVSLGVADLLEHAGNGAGLVREADRALYGAKAAGRNRTAVAQVDDVLVTEPEGPRVTRAS